MLARPARLRQRRRQRHHRCRDPGPVPALRRQPRQDRYVDHADRPRLARPDPGRPTPAWTYLNARYYDPALAHFISVDEMTDEDHPAARQPLRLRRRQPHPFNDPTGLWPGWAKKAANFVSDHSDTIADIAVGAAAGTLVAAGCVATAGIGCAIAAGAIAGAAGASAGYGVRVATGRESFSAKNLAKSAAIGSIAGAIGGSVGGKAVRAGLQRAAKIMPKSVTAAGGKVSAGVTKAGTKISSKVSNAGKKAVAKVKSLGSNCVKHSFDPATPVVMADGSAKPISQIRLGEQVLSADPSNGESSAQPVSALHTNEDDDLVSVSVVGGPKGGFTLHTTAHHPFFDATVRSWVEADDLVAGHRLFTSDGTEVTVGQVTPEPGTAVRRDLTVDQWHAYYVGAPGSAVLVHNCDEVTVYHFTDKKGYDAIRAGDPYHIKPGDSKNGAGPFFSTKSPGELSKPGAYKQKLGLTAAKSEYVMEMKVPKKLLKPIRGGRAHIKQIPGRVKVPRSKVRYKGSTRGWKPA